MFSFQVFVFAVVAAILLLLSSALLADMVTDYLGFFPKETDKIRAAAVSLSLLYN